MFDYEGAQKQNYPRKGAVMLVAHKDEAQREDRGRHERDDDIRQQENKHIAERDQVGGIGEYLDIVLEIVETHRRIRPRIIEKG